MNKNVLARRPSPAFGLSVAALVVALGGTGYAASQLPAESVGKKQLKDDSVTGAKVADGSLGKKDFKKGELPAGPKGAPGPLGPSDGYFVQGPANVPIGAGWVDVAGVDLPPGSYLISGSTSLVNFSATEENVAVCGLRKGAEVPTVGHSAVIGKSTASPDGEAVTTVGIDGAMVLAQATHVGLACTFNRTLTSPSPAFAENGQLTALKVATLH